MPRRSKDYAICPCCNKVTDLTGEASERDPNLDEFSEWIPDKSDISLKDWLARGTGE